MPVYSVQIATPTVEDYCRLRRQAGLTPRSETAAATGLAGTFMGVVVEYDGEAVGMGRVVGDGALFFQIVDVAVQPAHQGQGLGKRIMASLMTELRERITAEAYVSLIADGNANRLYTQFGFEPTAPSSIGMALWLR